MDNFVWFTERQNDCNILTSLTLKREMFTLLYLFFLGFFLKYDED